MSSKLFPGRQQLWIIAAFATIVTLSSAQVQTPKPSRSISVVASTIPANGDVNPYGIFRVPVSQGHLTAGNLLISNFNNSANLQGTGTTIVQI